jgi:hypothetical protein
MVFNSNVILPRGAKQEDDPVFRLPMAERKIFASLN